ncbi:11676_t:CDS:2 [Acaulospora colombiana]|uniref:11676_t:CDS:1 n=1 Tax=Acaulospora colombiana TaxID=27376 RepID=A0ACA9NYD9_9GLOM|nr:11676_t:CDS:2 [Acaulospora colombiana]
MNRELVVSGLLVTNPDEDLVKLCLVSPYAKDVLMVEEYILEAVNLGILDFSEISQFHNNRTVKVYERYIAWYITLSPKDELCPFTNGPFVHLTVRSFIMAKTDTNTLIIQIHPERIETLKTNHYILCIARSIGDTKANPEGNRSMDNEFSWENNYKVFGAEEVKEGKPINSETDSQSIAFGQTCIIDDQGRIGAAQGTKNKSGAFKLKNEWTKPNGINAGVACELKVRDNNLHYGTDQTGGKAEVVYVTPEKLLQGTSVTFTPFDKMTIWFQWGGKTGVMISEIDNDKLMVDFAHDGAKTVICCFNKDGKWQLGPLPSE